MRPLVVGIGNPYRRDDGIGPVVAERLARDGVDVELSDGEPTRLLECWADRDVVVVVDAVQGAPPGTVLVEQLLSDEDHRAGGDDAGRVSSRISWPVSTHGGGIIQAIALGRQLDRIPGRLTLVGVSGEDFGQGDGLSPPVAEAVDDAVAAVVDAIGARLPR